MLCLCNEKLPTASCWTKRFLGGGYEADKTSGLVFILWSLQGRQPFSFLHSPVAACDVKQSVFCSTKDICL